MNLLKFIPLWFKIVVQRPRVFLEQELAVSLIDSVNLSMCMDCLWQIPEVRKLLMGFREVKIKTSKFLRLCVVH